MWLSIPKIVFFLLLPAVSIWAQVTNPSTYDLQFANGSYNCNTQQYCIDIQIKAATGAGQFALGTHTIVFNYSTAAIQSPTYQPINFHPTAAPCIGPGGFQYQSFQSQGFSFSEIGSGLANLTTNLNFYLPGFECPFVAQDWITMGTVCFSVVNASLNPGLSFNTDLTAINISTNAPSPQHMQGTFTGNNIITQPTNKCLPVEMTKTP